MTEKQKQAIVLLNNLQRNNSIKDDDYFLLLEFVIEQHNEPTTIYPWTRLTEVHQPLDPVYGYFGKVTCNKNSIETALTNEKDNEVINKHL